MTKPNNLHINQLEETLAQLTAALAAQERRSVAKAKIVRWGAIVVIAAVATMAPVAVNIGNDAQAVTSGGSSGNISACDPMNPATMQTQACVFEQTSRFFHTMNQLMVGMAQTEEVTRWIHNNPIWVEQAKNGIVDQMSRQNPKFRDQWNNCQQQPDNPKCQELLDMVDSAAKQMVFGGLVAQTFVNAGTLINRIREDSDEIRHRTGHVGGPVGAVALELQRMNIALASVPAMVIQMDLMNRNMASMTHSMGSTMGRMGSWMPW